MHFCIGNIHSINGHDVTVAIGEKWLIKGDIQCDYLVASGTIIGNVQVTNKVEILDQARIEGDVSYSLLSMDPGATVQGHFSCLYSVLHFLKQENPFQSIAQSNFEKILP